METTESSVNEQVIFDNYQDQGLTLAEVEARIKKGDVNKVSLRSSRTYTEILKDNLFTIFNISLGSVLLVLVILGRSSDAFFAGISVFTNIIVGIFQEIRAKLILDKIALLSIHKVTVIRENQEIQIPINEVVRDELILLRPGDKAPVDGTCINSQMLEIDESLLTGESEPISKQKGDEILSGSFCLAGKGLLKAEKIGNESYVAIVTKSSRQYKHIVTPLQEKIDVLVEIFLIALVFATLFHIVASIHLGRSLGDTLSLLTVIINSFVPAGLIIAISVSFAVGAVKISSYNTLIQRINAIDSMNSVKILCMDKTGTLTQNKLSVETIIPLLDTSEITLKNLIALYTNLISAQNTTALALAEFVENSKIEQAKIAEIPFNSNLKWGAITLDNEKTIIVGSPELLLTNLESKETAKKLSKKGLRVIAIVTCESVDIEKKELPKIRQDRGLIIIKDDLRLEAKETIKNLQNNNIEIKIISGDSLETVKAIAEQAGIFASEKTVFSQEDLDKFDDSMFNRAAIYGQVFGRIKPDTKRRLVNTLVRQGNYVAMIGDGVNDVQALKEAQLAISMNDGSQITKDIADIVLLNNSLKTLVKAFVAGDTIKQKILISAKLFLTKNIMVIIAILLVGFVQLPFPIIPSQLSILTFPSVTAPTILIALGIFHPRRINNFTRNVLGSSILAGLIGGLAITIGYILTYVLNIGLINVSVFLDLTEYWEQGLPEAQGIAVVIGLIYTFFIFLDSCHISIWKPWTLTKKMLPTVVGLIIVISLIVVLFSFPDVFRVEKPDGMTWLIGIFLPFISHYTLRCLQCSSYFRYLSKLFNK
jgi:cation-transporting P-type ATPase E